MEESWCSVNNTAKINFIRSKLTECEVLTQLAEEASELSQAALKLRRAQMDINPTPVPVPEAEGQLEAEYMDVLTCLVVLGRENVDNDMISARLFRWAERLKVVT